MLKFSRTDSYTITRHNNIIINQITPLGLKRFIYKQNRKLLEHHLKKISCNIIKC